MNYLLRSPDELFYLFAKWARQEFWLFFRKNPLKELGDFLPKIESITPWEGSVVLPPPSSPFAFIRHPLHVFCRMLMPDQRCLSHKSSSQNGLSSQIRNKKQSFVVSSSFFLLLLLLLQIETRYWRRRRWWWWWQQQRQQQRWRRQWQQDEDNNDDDDGDDDDNDDDVQLNFFF